MNAEQQETPKKAPIWRRFLPLLVILLGFGAFFGLGFGEYLSFEALSDNRERLIAWRDDNLMQAVIAFTVAYTVLTAFSVPVGLWLTLLGGFMFGTIAGGLLSLSGATVGATVIFLAARYAFGDFLKNKAGAGIAKMEAGFRENELTYMFVLRLVPLFPFWLVNLVPAFLNVSTRTYMLGTFFGMIPGAMVYASVGNGLGAVFETGAEPDLGIIFSPEILTPIIGLAVLSMIPIFYKKIKKPEISKD
ncbi:MAG: TVP38/TMEM64 family protein [Rhodospirillaceae bacterium]|nr:TVP38/TMEM64 family protein [Rhodospirillaceae bacterium]MBT4219152.1 TVP38/TMEM64 family protein [Rhodospirillaceae bacterium]MBT4463179.1 TVP38/TMEM64 family protein [Rhodospirillaceae bacterium]MBT5013575.1 TVP38/TMEM64 family protein [Rhodospirillaceae bacterium]MBT5308895.1 TVP38/TMEM64 family protein [Rhodospirillaceae bacterium]